MPGDHRGGCREQSGSEDRHQELGGSTLVQPSVSVTRFAKDPVDRAVPNGTIVRIDQTQRSGPTTRSGSHLGAGFEQCLDDGWISVGPCGQMNGSLSTTPHAQAERRADGRGENGLPAHDWATASHYFGSDRQTRLRFYVRACRHQHADHRSILVRFRRSMKGGDPCRHGSSFDESCASLLWRRGGASVSSNVGSRREQCLHDLGGIAAGRNDQRRIPLGIARLEIGAGLHEGIDDRRIRIEVSAVK